MSESITDNRTLAEIAEDDAGMVDDAIKNAKKYNFGPVDTRVLPPFPRRTPNLDKAMAFIGDCLNKTLVRCGLTMSRHIKPKMAEMLLKRHHIKIESRHRYKDPKNAWRNGIYIYKKDELVAYISNIFVYRPGQFAIDRSPYISVITNAKV